MNIGLDIDDVLYSTSSMIRRLSPEVLREANIPDQLREYEYEIAKRCNMDENQWTSISNKFRWYSIEYINRDAIKQLKALKHLHPNIEYSIVTWRSLNDAAPIIRLLQQYFNFPIKQCYCLSADKSKAELCRDKNIKIMLDDCCDVINSFKDTPKNVAILVSPDDVLHNKPYLHEQEYILKNWSELPNLIETITRQYSF